MCIRIGGGGEKINSEQSGVDVARSRGLFEDGAPSVISKKKIIHVGKQKKRVATRYYHIYVIV